MSDRRQAMIDKARAQMDQADAEIDRLSAKAREANADQRIELENEMDRMRQRRQAAKEQVEAMADTTTDAWEDLKGGAQKAWKELEDAVDNARRRFG